MRSLLLLALVSGAALAQPADSSFAAAERLALAGQTGAALARLSGSATPESLRLRARLAMDLGRPHLAVAALADADTLDAEAQLTLGHARRALGDTRGAETAYRHAYRAAPGGPATGPLAGLVARQRPAEAAALYRVLVAQDSANPAHHLALGRALVRLDSVERGRFHFVRAWMLYPQGEDAAVGAAETLEGDPAAQLGWTDQALRALPQSARLWRVHGAASMRVGDLDGAVEAYANALAWDDSTAARLRDLGVALYYAGRAPEAVAALRESHARDSTDATTLRVYGLAAHAENEADLALRLLARATDALGREPLADLYGEIARVQRDALRDADALASLATAERLAPEDATIVLNRAALLQQIGRLEDAERGYREFLDRAPDADPSLRALAEDRAAALATIRQNRIERDLRRRLNE